MKGGRDRHTVDGVIIHEGSKFLESDAIPLCGAGLCKASVSIESVYII